MTQHSYYHNNLARHRRLSRPSWKTRLQARIMLWWVGVWAGTDAEIALLERGT